MSYEVISNTLIRPDNAQWLLVLGHGASTNMRHTTLQTIAERLADVGIASRGRSKRKRRLSGDRPFGGRSYPSAVINGCGRGTLGVFRFSLASSATNWENSTCYNLPVRGLATRRRCTFWTPLTTVLRSSNVLARPTKMCSWRWRGSSMNGSQNWVERKQGTEISVPYLP